MEDKRVDLIELKGDTLRCVIPYKDNDENEKQIEIYNIVGDRRMQILSYLNDLTKENEDLTEYIVDSYYTNLIMEFTDIKLDETNISDIITSPKLEFQILKHELDEMIYELQYEDLCKKKNQSRVLILEGMRQQVDYEFRLYTDSLEKSVKTIEKINNKEVDDNEL